MNFLIKLLYLDLRSLALMRFTLGLLVFYDFLRRWPYAEVFYSDAGILKRSVLMAKFHHIWKPTILFLNGTETYAHILLVIGMVASLFYALGIRTRLSNFIMWLLLISFHERFRLALNAGDILMTLMLFWSFFLPVNAVASWDSAWLKESERERFEKGPQYQFFNVFSFAWLSLIFSMYLFTFFYKWHPDWFKEGTTLYYALHLETFTTWLGRWLLNFPGLLKFLSISTLWLEGLGPLLLLIPFKVHLMRMIAICAFLGLHLGIAATMNIGTFALCCCLLWLPLVPSEFWQWLSQRMQTKIPNEPYMIYYDKDCDFCKRMVYALSSLLCVKNVEIYSSEASDSVHKKIQKENSWAGGVKESELAFRWQNFTQLLKYSTLFPIKKLLRLLPPRFGDNLYIGVATNRQPFSTLMTRIGHSAILLKPNKLTVLFGIFALYLSFNFNMDGISKGKVMRLSRDMKRAANFLRLNQKWNMFAPYPVRSEGWLVVEGTLVDGSKVDPWRGGAVDFSRPKDLASEYPNNVWRKVVSRLRNDSYKDYRLYFGKYLCRSYNNEVPHGGARLQTFKIYFMRDKTPAPGWLVPPIKKYELWSHSCFKKTSWPN